VICENKSSVHEYITNTFGTSIQVRPPQLLDPKLLLLRIKDVFEAWISFLSLFLFWKGK